MKPRQLVPDPMPLGDAMSASAALAGLAERMRASNARFAAIRAELPPTLAGQVKPGPFDDAGWSLLAANAGVAAKLRHLVPRLHDGLAAAGLPVAAIRVKVLA